LFTLSLKYISAKAKTQILIKTHNNILNNTVENKKAALKEIYHFGMQSFNIFNGPCMHKYRKEVSFHFKMPRNQWC